MNHAVEDSAAPPPGWRQADYGGRHRTRPVCLGRYRRGAGPVAARFLASGVSGSGAVGRDEGERAVEGVPERAGVTAGLGENESALEAGEGGGGEPVGVGAGPESAGGDHGREAGPDAGLPAVEAVGQDGPDVVVAFADLPEEAGDRAASFPAPLLLEGDEGVESGRLPSRSGRSCRSPRRAGSVKSARASNSGTGRRS
jgi:hypothetical protein